MVPPLRLRLESLRNAQKNMQEKFTCSRCYDSFIIPNFIMRKLISVTLACAIFSFLSAPLTTQAFIDTEGLTQSIEELEQSLEGEGNDLGSLLEELDAAAKGDPTSYLQVTIGEEAVTMWDVPKDSWFYSHVQVLTDLEIVSGYKDAEGNPTGEYGPGNNVTHAEALKIALGSAGVDVGGCDGILAHPQAMSHWAKDYVLCAQGMNFGVTSSIDLNASASRAEVLHYVLKAFGIDVSEGSPPFADSADHELKNDIAYAYALEIVSGDTNPDGSEKGTFRPNDSVNRAEVAKIVREAMGVL